jgi:hypothetical protein
MKPPVGRRTVQWKEAGSADRRHDSDSLPYSAQHPGSAQPKGVHGFDPKSAAADVACSGVNSREAEETSRTGAVDGLRLPGIVGHLRDRAARHPVPLVVL